ASSRVHRCGLPLESSAPDLAGRSASFSSAVSNRLLVAHHSLTGSAEAGERCLYGRLDAYSTPERSTHVCSERVWTSGRGPVFVRSEAGYGAPRRRSLSDGLRLSGPCKPEARGSNPLRSIKGLLIGISCCHYGRKSGETASLRVGLTAAETAWSREFPQVALPAEEDRRSARCHV